MVAAVRSWKRWRWSRKKALERSAMPPVAGGSRSTGRPSDPSQPGRTNGLREGSASKASSAGRKRNTSCVRAARCSAPAPVVSAHRSVSSRVSKKCSSPWECRIAARPAAGWRCPARRRVRRRRRGRRRRGRRTGCGCPPRPTRPGRPRRSARPRGCGRPRSRPGWPGTGCPGAPPSRRRRARSAVAPHAGTTSGGGGPVPGQLGQHQVVGHRPAPSHAPYQSAAPPGPLPRKAPRNGACQGPVRRPSGRCP